jgi:hypothetical protein
MTEYVPPDAGVFKEGYKPNTETVILELHRLLAIFLSSRSFAELREGSGESWESIDHIQQYEEDEITRILLAIAITARVIDDREQRVFDLVAGDCGTLSHVGSNEISPLTLREACNKIIHAQKVRFDVSITEAGQQYLNPTIYLYGKRQNRAEWKVELNVLVFAREYVSCLRHF